MKNLIFGILLIALGILQSVAIIIAAREPDADPNTYFALAIPLATWSLGLLLIWRHRRKFQQHEQQRVTAQQITTNSKIAINGVELTPSEMVLMSAMRYAKPSKRKGFVTLDGETKVSDDLLVPLLCAAFIANVRRGCIKLQMTETPDQLGLVRNRLVAVPGDADLKPPAWTVESQILPPTTKPVYDIVRDWLAHQSDAPKKRGLEKAMIGLTLRGLARLDFFPREGRYYRWAIPPTESELSAATEPAAQIQAEFEESEPELSAQLVQSIRKGIRSRRWLGDGQQEVDPWLDEAESDRAPFRELLKLETTMSWVNQSLSISAVPSMLSVFVYIYVPDPVHALTWAAIITGIAAIAYLVDWRLRSPKRDPTTVGRHLIVGVPSSIFAIGTFALVWSWSPVAAVVVASAASFLAASRAFRSRVKATLSKQVVRTENEAEADSDETALSAATKVDVSAPQISIASAAVLADSDLKIEIVDPENLPEPSPEALERVQAVEQRGWRIRNQYAYCVLMMAAAFAGIAAFARYSELGVFGSFASQGTRSWVYGQIFPASVQNHFVWMTAFFIVTLFLFICGKGLGWIFRTGAVRQQSVTTYKSTWARERAWQSEIRPICPLFFPLLGGLWVYFGIGVIDEFSRVETPWHYILVVASVGSPVAAYLWLRGARSRVERRYPVYPPLRLLALRVFGSTDLGAYIMLIDRWHWFGTLLTLEGPDTSGESLRDFTRYITGSIEESVIKNENELHTALATFNEERNTQLRFPTNSLQFNDATWREALDRILDRSHVVVMDLTGFSKKNEGCAYEIATLIEKAPLNRFILLVNDCTDMEFLVAMIRTAWAAKSPDSPNASVDSPVLRLFRIGGVLERGPGESQIQWQRRLESRIDRVRLVAMLYDAALCEESPEIREALRKPQTIPWGTIALPPRVRSFCKIAAIAFVCFTLATNWFGLTAQRSAPEESFFRFETPF